MGVTRKRRGGKRHTRAENGKGTEDSENENKRRANHVKHMRHYCERRDDTADDTYGGGGGGTRGGGADTRARAGVIGEDAHGRPEGTSRRPSEGEEAGGNRALGCVSVRSARDAKGLAGLFSSRFCFRFHPA